MQLTPVHFVSYSSLNTFHECPRKYQIYRLGADTARESSVTFAFGHAVGAGIQKLLSGGSLEDATWEAFKFWDVDLLARDANETKWWSKKSFAYAVNAIRKFEAYARVILKDYEVAQFNGRPAVELSFNIALPGGYQYRGHIDVVLRHRTTGQLLVVELKTTKAKTILEATYGNSEQALSYSVVLDKIGNGNSSYYVWYFVYQTEEEDYQDFTFQKTVIDKAKWIKSLVHDVNHIEDFREDSFWPKRGSSCVSFFRPCQYYDTCGMSDKFLLASEAELEKRVAKELETKYTFNFTLEELIEQQLS